MTGIITANFLVIGHEGAGKSTFIQTGAPHNAEMPINETLKIALHEAPLDAWPQYIARMLGVVLLVDGASPPFFKPTISTWEAIQASKHPLPCIIGVNKQDDQRAEPASSFQALLPDNAIVKVFPCIATDKASVENILLALIFQILSGGE